MRGEFVRRRGWGWVGDVGPENYIITIIIVIVVVILVVYLTPVSLHL